MKFVVPAFVGVLGLASLASSWGHPVPRVVAQLTPPSGETLLLRAFAQGVQVYECVDGAAGPQWIFRAPEATLVDERGKPLGKHYAGPTWESNDGSKVVGRLVASADAADPSAIPHLLLKAESHAGDGVFANVRSIQRLQTVGGRAPRAGCDAKELTRQTRVYYTATYYFYGQAPGAY
ncbi:MAG: DUF3455 domain-containing protein [Bacillota bacterium]